MSFVPNAAEASARAIAAADDAYLEDIRCLQHQVQLLQRYAAAVRVLRQQQSSKAGQQLPLYEHQHLHCRTLQQELAAARQVASLAQFSLQRVRQHVSAAPSSREKHDRQLLYTQLLRAAGESLHEIKSAAQGEEWMLLQHRQMLLEGPGGQLQIKDQRQSNVQQHRPVPQHSSLQHGRNLVDVRPHEVQPVTTAGGGASSAAAAPAAGSALHRCMISHIPQSNPQNAKSCCSAFHQAAAGPQCTYGGDPHASASGQARNNLLMPKSVPILIPEREVAASLLKEKHDNLAKIHQELKSIQDLYEQISFFSNEQDARIGALSAHISGARDEVALATATIAAAARDERKRRWRRCIFSVSLVIVIMLLCGAVWWNERSPRSTR